MIELLIVLGAIILTPIIGGLLAGVDRVVTARLQGRVGPPLLQPFYDVIKLLGKEPILTTPAQAVFAWAYLLFTIAAVVMFALGQDLLLIVFVLGFGGVAFIAGGFAVKSPYANVGAQREIAQMVAYEPTLILIVIAFYLVNKSFSVASIFAAPQPMLLSLPLAFLALLVILEIKLRKSPFDLSASHHAHQELVRGITTEYSGPYLAIIELTHWYEAVFVLAFVALFWATMPLVGALIAVASFLLALVIDNVTARLTWSWMLKFAWSFGIVLVAANIALLVVKL
jgi:formate hydrogenlyase subunit 4